MRWGTYRQIQARGGQVRKGETGTRILSFQDHKRIAVTDAQGQAQAGRRGQARLPLREAQDAVRAPVHRVQRRAGRRAARARQPDPRASLEGAPGGREGHGGRGRAGTSRPGRPRLLPHEARRDRAARARAVPVRQPLLPDGAPRAGPQHRPPGTDEPRDARRRDQERVRIAGLRAGGTPGRDQRDDDRRARRRRARPEPGRRLRRGLGPGARGGPARDPARRRGRAEDLGLRARASHRARGHGEAKARSPRGNPWPWPRPARPGFSGSRCPCRRSRRPSAAPGRAADES